MGRVSDAKAKLLAVAFDLIHEHSYGSVSVEQICSRAKVNKGSFYYFFKSKTDLVVAAYEERWRLKEADYERVFASTKPPLKRLELWCDYIRATQKQREKPLRERGRRTGDPGQKNPDLNPETDRAARGLPGGRDWRSRGGR